MHDDDEDFFLLCDDVKIEENDAKRMGDFESLSHD